MVKLPYHPNVLVRCSSHNCWGYYLYTQFHSGSISFTLLNVNKQCIPLIPCHAHGKCSQTMLTSLLGNHYSPSIKEWLTRIARIAEMERLISIAHETPTKFSFKWACGTHFQTTAYYRDLIALNTLQGNPPHNIPT